MEKRLRWGILGTGVVAGELTEALQFTGAPVTMVASRNPEKAKKFAKKYGIPHAAQSYEEVARSGEVDICYIALPHNLHAGMCALCLGEGKHVLCEKPFTVTTAEARAVFEAARAANRFIMEAAWCRFHPLLLEVLDAVRGGLIGEVGAMKADFGIDDVLQTPNHRLLDPDLAGGALLDGGFYPVTLACMLFGSSPQRVQSSCTLSERGVDLYTSAILDYPGGRQALLYASIVHEIPDNAYLYGSKGYVELENFFYCRRATAHLRDGSVRVFERQFECDGYEYETRHVEECIEQGLTQSPILPWEETLRVLEILQQAAASDSRRQVAAPDSRKD